MDTAGIHEPQGRRQSKGRGQRLDRLGAGALRLLHLRRGGVAGVPAELLSFGRSHDRHRRLARDLRRRLRRPAHRRLRARPSRQHPWAQGRAAAAHVPDGLLDGGGRSAATYGQVGVLAPALLAVLRLIQGFAVAGEISGASSMILEHAPFGRRGIYASFTLQDVQAGQILAAAVVLPLARFMPPEAFNSWAGGCRSCSAQPWSPPAPSSGGRPRKAEQCPRRRPSGRSSWPTGSIRARVFGKGLSGY